MIKEGVFRAYDIRGVYPEDINEDTAYAVGRAIVIFLKADNVVVGRDMRVSSPSLFEALSKGINDQGADVIDIGMCTTPMLGFAVVNYSHEAGIMISASHNPPEYNAFKLIRKPALQICAGSGMDEIKELAIKEDFTDPESKGKILQKNPLEDYIAHVLKFTKGISQLKIVCDYGNGVGAISALELFKNMDLEVINLYPEPDGTFPNHFPNPHDLKNMEEIKKKVVDEKADLGIFFDGDADRSIIIDNEGEIVFPDFLLALLSEPELKKNPGEKVYFDLRFSKIVKEVIEKQGGKPHMMRVGNPFYKEKLSKEGGVMGGEFSGHIMFKDNFSIDDGLFAAVKIMSLLCDSEKKLSELVKPLKVYYQTPEINIKLDNMGRGDQIFEAVREKFKDENIITIDGVSVESEGWWFNLRKSNTEPLMRLRVEADTEAKMNEVKDIVLDIIG